MIFPLTILLYLYNMVYIITVTGLILQLLFIYKL